MMMAVDSLGRDSEWSQLRVVVAGVGLAGFACADVLVELGARVISLDSGEGEPQRERADLLDVLGVDVRLGSAGDQLPMDIDLLVVSPGFPPNHQLIRTAIHRDVPVWGELELAWRLRSEPTAAEWLVVTGTNGKTTTTLMLESMLRAAGLATVSAGNIGNPLVYEVMNGTYDAIAIEVGAPQLPFVYSMSPQASVCLNLAEDHVDHFGTYAEYVSAKSLIYTNTRVAAVYNVADAATEQLVIDADVVEGCRAIGFTLGIPAPSMLGVVEDILVDRAFLPTRHKDALPLASLSDVRPAAPHQVANALAAAALARAHGVPPMAVRDGLRSFEPAGHRIAEVATVDGVRYVDDSKATNCHAAQTSMLAYEHLVWIAGGLAKGQSFDDLVRQTRDRLRGVVLLGADRAVIATALRRHAPDVPVVEVERRETGAMVEVVRAAAALARVGDVVLLAPGCASWDMFRDYADRGDQFAAAVRESAAGVDT
jgi:UDP-N-acetylmuramoylalanine--D-glutamate ligase